MNPWKKKCLTLAVICSVMGTTQVYAAEKSAETTSTAVDLLESEESLSDRGGHDLGETTVTATRIARAFRHNVKELAIRLRVQLIKHNAMNIEAML